MQAICQKAIAICRERAHTGISLRAPRYRSRHLACRARPGLTANLGKQMQNLSPRHVKTEEALRLGVLSGWYSTKVSGNFVSGPNDSEADCQHRINEINPPPKKRK